MLAHRRVCLQSSMTLYHLQVFKVIYDFNPLSPLDILPLPLQERTNMDASARASYLKKVHENTRQTIERQVTVSWTRGYSPRRLPTSGSGRGPPWRFTIGPFQTAHTAYKGDRTRLGAQDEDSSKPWASNTLYKPGPG